LGCYAVSVYYSRKRGRIPGVDGTSGASPAPVQHVCLDHGRLYIFMPEKLLYGPDVISMHEQIRGKAVAGNVASATAVAQPMLLVELRGRL
jgi:hypothetical protein